MKDNNNKQDTLPPHDHRRLGRELGLWTFSDLVGSGLPLFTPKGTVIRDQLFKALLDLSKRYGMESVAIPHIAKRKLYEVSGHAQKFGDELLKVISHYDEFVMKPVNCPHHTQIYDSEIRSYKDLPIRYIESTMQYRDEQPGEMAGLTRVRAITVDDGHIFCTVDQIKQEVINVTEIIKEFYSKLGMYGNHWISLSVRDSANPEKYIGEAKDWDKAEKMLSEISTELSLNAKRCEGEAAIYGPKLDYMFTDSLGRERQLATVQIDFSMPKRFELNYVDSDGSKKTPVMIHRAILGSYERFIAILLEHFAGWLPCWLAPLQIAVIPVLQNHNLVAAKFCEQLKEKDIRYKYFDEKENLGKKVRNAKDMKIPFTVVIGDKEIENGRLKIQNTKNSSIFCESNAEDAIRSFLGHIVDKKL